MMLPFIPESHIYHIRRNNEEQAKKCMLRIYGTAPDYDVVGFLGSLQSGGGVCYDAELSGP